MRRLLRLLVPCLFVACAGPSPLDGGLPSPEDAGAEDAGVEAPTAAGYCEASADFFCAYYLRCGRIVAADQAECRAVFLESCNERYESRYVDLEDAGLLRLSTPGLDACRAHLETVPCAQQLTDLMGPCGAVWVGTQPAGAACGLDVQSFTCAPGTNCVLGLNFCGTCKPASASGGPCGDGGTCVAEAACVSGTCVTRRQVGEACATSQPCVVGASCQSGFCVGPLIVKENEFCDATHRCPYRSTCLSGRCVRSALLGESCVDRSCASGRCVTEGATKVCRPFLEAGAPCASPSECRSASCVMNVCRALPDACFP